MMPKTDLKMYLGMMIRQHISKEGIINSMIPSFNIFTRSEI